MATSWKNAGAGGMPMGKEAIHRIDGSTYILKEMAHDSGRTCAENKSRNRCFAASFSDWIYFVL